MSNLEYIEEFADRFGLTTQLYDIRYDSMYMCSKAINAGAVLTIALSNYRKELILELHFDQYGAVIANSTSCINSFNLLPAPTIGLDIIRSELSDSTLLNRFKIILNQVKYIYRPDDILLQYISELEFRGLKYNLL